MNISMVSGRSRNGGEGGGGRSGVRVNKNSNKKRP